MKSYGPKKGMGGVPASGGLGRAIGGVGRPPKPAPGSIGAGIGGLVGASKNPSKLVSRKPK
jgi:hypothetical protein